MLDENPFCPTQQSVPEKGSNSFGAAAWWIVYLQPAIVLMLMHSCWALTAASLGRPPRFGEHPADDVAHIVVHILDFSAMLLILGAPVLIPTALCWALARPFAALHREGRTISVRIVCLAAYLMILATAAWICYSDPFRVVCWFVD